MAGWTIANTHPWSVTIAIIDFVFPRGCHRHYYWRRHPPYFPRGVPPSVLLVSSPPGVSPSPLECRRHCSWHRLFPVVSPSLVLASSSLLVCRRRYYWPSCSRSVTTMTIGVGWFMYTARLRTFSVSPLCGGYLGKTANGACGADLEPIPGSGAGGRLLYIMTARRG